MAQLLTWLASPGARTSAGAAVTSGFAYFYEPGGGTTQANVYADADATEIMTQPVALDAGGRATVYTITPVRVLIQDATTADVSDLDQGNVIRAEAVQVDNQWWSAGYLDGVLTAIGESTGGPNGTYMESGGATARSIQEKFSELSVSVKDFGAQGDGLTIDTTAIQAAINRVGFLGGGEVYFPPGTYLVDQLLTNAITGVSFRGASATIENTSATNGVLAITGVSRFSISNLAILASTASTGSAITITGGSNIALSRVRIEDHRKGVVLTSTGSGTVIDASFVVCNDADSAARGIDATDSAFTLSNTYVYPGSTGYSVDLDGASTCTVMASALDIAGVTFENSLTGTGFRFIGNTISDPAFVFNGVSMPKGFYQRGNGVDGATIPLLSGATHNIDLALGWTFLFDATTTGSTITVNAPITPPATTDYGVYMDLVFWNHAGGAMTAWTLGASLHKSALPSTVDGERTAYRFWWDPGASVWREVSRAVTT